MATQVQTILVQPEEDERHRASGELVPLEFAEIPDARNSSYVADATVPVLSNLRKIVIVTQLCGVNFTSAAVNGLVIVGLPRITADLQLPPSLAFWPTSVSSLANASTLLIAGSVADILGPRSVDLFGCVTAGLFMVGAGAVRNGSELVAMRALQGVGIAMHYSSSVAIVSNAMPRGRGRNIGFSCLGFSQVLGFALGLVLGGILVDTVGWRAGWYLYGATTLVFSAIGFWALPREKYGPRLRDLLENVRRKVDWVGAMLASTFMAMISYLLAVLSTDVYKIKSAECIVLLCLSVVALPAFVAWVDRQVRLGKPALIPNSLWKNRSFACICGIVTLSFAVLNSLELFASLFFQDIQHLSALQASIRILPSLLVGAILNLSTGVFVDRIPAFWIVTVTSILSAGAPLLMAVINPSWPYWANAFVAQLLQPISCDALFTVGLVLITEVFPEDTQGLAGGVFNTASQFGNAFGLAVVQIVSALVTKSRVKAGDPNALMEGYRASFWTMFAIMMVCFCWGVVGMRKIGRIGLKQD